MPLMQVEGRSEIEKMSLKKRIMFLLGKYQPKVFLYLDTDKLTPVEIKQKGETNGSTGS